ncbi:MAG: hypothetical protein NC336_09440 [Clostridium sp.]|nr:hypothetical protein [Clostridium sp.]
MLTKKRNVILRVVAWCPGWLLTVLAVGLMLWLTLSPQPLPENDIELFPGADKLVHGLMFGGIAWLAGIDFIVRGERHRSCNPLAVFVVAAVAASLLGGAVEILQEGMALGRSGDLADWLADTAGAALAVPAGLLTVRGECRR